MKENNVNNKYIIIPAIMILLLVVIGSTYAFFSVRADDNTTAIKGVTSSPSLEIDVEEVTEQDSLLIPMANDLLDKALAHDPKCIDDNNNDVCDIYRITITNTGDTSLYVTSNVTLTGNALPNLVWRQITDPNTLKAGAVDNSLGTNQLIQNDVINIDSSKDYYIMVYINEIEKEQSDHGTYSGVVSANGFTTEVQSSRETAVETITKLYTSASKSTTDNGDATNGIVTYNYAPIYDTDSDNNTSGGIMNDRLGSMSTDIDSGNIRYYGANPSNYIYFNCDTYPDTNCELWRIIGVFKDIKLADGSTKDLIKIAHSDVTTTNTQWDDDSNDWYNATLQTSLNTTYYKGTNYNGLKGITAGTRSKIAKVTWNLGGWDDADGVYPNKLYEHERGSLKCTSCTYDTTWNGEIALMYPSDYGYATDLSVCKKDPYNYESTTDCYGKDWLFKNETEQWLLTPDSDDSNFVWSVSSSGFVDSDGDVYYSRAVRPVLYLDSEQIIESGSGTSGDPYKLSA